MNEVNVLDLFTRISALPGVKIDRKSFLTEKFSVSHGDRLEEIMEYGPRNAGVSKEEVDELARKCINFETTKATALSVAAGIPGGVAMFAATSVDAVQETAHMLRIAQKLSYLYGFGDNMNNLNDDDVKATLIIFIGIMYGVEGASNTLRCFASKAAKDVTSQSAVKTLSKGTFYPIAKSIAKELGIKLSEKSFASGVSKAIPIVSGALSGALTYFTFKPMAHKLMNDLSESVYGKIYTYNVIEV